MNNPDFTYRAIVKSVYDGDTITVDLDLGCWTWRHNETLRLWGIDTPEVRGIERPEGLESRDWLREKLPVGTEIVVQTRKDSTGKYGRLLATLWLDGMNLNIEMVRLGLAETYMAN